MKYKVFPSNYILANNFKLLLYSEYPNSGMGNKQEK